MHISQSAREIARMIICTMQAFAPGEVPADCLGRILPLICGHLANETAPSAAAIQQRREVKA